MDYATFWNSRPVALGCNFSAGRPGDRHGRLLTLEDTVEFFNLVLSLQLADDEKQSLAAFMRCL